MVRNDMKKIMICAAAAAMFGAVSCGPQYEEPQSGSSTAFALSFFKEVNRNTPSDQNVLTSPYSAGVLLSMLAEGAEGQTREEFDQVLGGSLYKAEDLGSNDTLTVNSANSIWVSDNFSVRNRYVSLLEKDFDAFITTQNFADPATVRAINNWCAEHTSDKILEIIDEISPNDVMILINALYFNAPWQDKFNPENTEDAVFHGKSGDVTVPMMFRRGRYNYIGYQGCKLIQIPYAAGDYSMYILLPPPGMSPDDVIPHISEYALNSAIKLMAPKEVVLRMPKFTLETEMLLNEPLQKMGLESAFSAAANFKGISAMGPLSLSVVKQKCYIDVSERGTEAAAVTSAQVRMTAVRAPQEFTVDRPFIYIIASDEGKNILFAGKTVNL